MSALQLSDISIYKARSELPGTSAQVPSREKDSDAFLVESFASFKC